MNKRFIKWEDIIRELHVNVYRKYEYPLDGEIILFLHEVAAMEYLKILTFAKDGIIVESTEPIKHKPEINGFVEDGYVWTLKYDSPISMNKELFGIYTTEVMAYNASRDLRERIAFEVGDFIVEKMELDVLDLDLIDLYTGIKR